MPLSANRVASSVAGLLLAVSTVVPLGAAQAAPAVPSPAQAGAAASTALTGVVTIDSDLQKADNATGILTASGNVRIVYADRGVVATARQAQYFSREGRLVLSGDVDVVQEAGNSIRAERLVYLVDGERLVAEPATGQQVLTFLRFRTPASGLSPVPTAEP